MDPELMLTEGGTVHDEYAAYVSERHRIWELRSMGLPAPWTRSPILAVNKFTNNFRILDRGSQYVLRMVQDAETPEDVVLRSFLYRFTNLPEVWDAYYGGEDGRWPVLSDVTSGRLEDFIRTYPQSLFSGAYMISPGMENTGLSRPQWLAQVTWETFSSSGWHQLDEAILDPQTPLSQRVEILKQVPRVGGFLAQQMATDIGYSDLLPTDENDSIVTGPGSAKGLKILGLPAKPSAIRELHGEIRSRVVLDVNGTPRPLSLMDIQNTLCEFSKYHGLLTARGNRGHRFAPGPNTAALHTDPLYPNHWS